MKTYIMTVTKFNNPKYDTEDSEWYPDRFVGVFKTWKDVYECINKRVSELRADNVDVETYIHYKPVFRMQWDGYYQNGVEYDLGEVNYDEDGYYTCESIKVYEIDI